nr:hypothetical protein [Tanacetum cinerariifolium]
MSRNNARKINAHSNAPISQEDYDVIMELETEDMERLQARLQRHKQDHFENEQQRKHEQEESHEDELWENEQEEQEESHEDELFENEQRKQEEEEKQTLTDYDEPISQEDYDVIMELETEDMERVQARLQHHKQEHI